MKEEGAGRGRGIREDERTGGWARKQGLRVRWGR